MQLREELARAQGDESTRNEVFTGGYRPDPDFPTLTWTEDNIGRAVFYYEGELNDRFMKLHT